MLKQPSTGLAAGLLTGALIVSLLNVLDVQIARSHDDPGVTLTSARAAESFVEDWTRMRQGTWAVESTFVRSTDNGQQYVTKTHHAQRPPDSIREDARTADVILDSKHYVCAADNEGTFDSCRYAGVAATFTSHAESDLASVRKDVLGPERLYDVQQRPNHCYGLYLRPTPKGTVGQWGTQAEVCFDPSTFAPVRTEVIRPGATDTVTAVQVRSNPGPDEIKVPAPIVHTSPPSF